MHQRCCCFVIGLLALLLPDAAAGQRAVRPNQDSLLCGNSQANNEQQVGRPSGPGQRFTAKRCNAGGQKKNEFGENDKANEEEKSRGRREKKKIELGTCCF